MVKTPSGAVVTEGQASLTGMGYIPGRGEGPVCTVTYNGPKALLTLTDTSADSGQS